MKLILLPGMDGTGNLFASFLRELSVTVEAQIVRYPRDEQLSYRDLQMLVQAAIAAVEPFVLLAESFSTPLAIRIAAENPPNLKGLILCAGFVSNPVQGWRRSMCLVLAPLLFRLPVPTFAIRAFLVGLDSPHSLLAEVRAALSLVASETLAARLRAILNCDERAKLPHIRVPALYLRAGHDSLISEYCVNRIVDMMPTTSVVIIDGPHLILQREPQKQLLSSRDLCRSLDNALETHVPTRSPDRDTDSLRTEANS